MLSKQILTCVVAGVVHPQVLGTIEEHVEPQQVFPVTPLGEADLSLDADSFAQRLNHYGQIDDVFSTGFTAKIVKSNGRTSEAAAAEWSVRPIYHLSITGTENGTLPSGPYFLHGRGLHQAWRLYPDDLDAFTFGLILESVIEPRRQVTFMKATEDTLSLTRCRFRALGSLSADGMWKSIAVPSRLYHKPSPEHPLAGARISVKDIFDVAGVKTTLSSKAYEALYSPAAENADFVKKLLSLGAVVVGKTKISQFATAQEWTDFQKETATKTLGKLNWSGCFTGRLSMARLFNWRGFWWKCPGAGNLQRTLWLPVVIWHSICEGAIINSPEYDVVGLFSRDLTDLHFISKAVLDIPKDTADFPKKILYPSDFFPLDDATQQAMVDEFITVLERHLDTKRVSFSIAERWNQNPPPEAKGKALNEYMKKTAFWSLCYDYYYAYDAFREEYKEKFDKIPFVERSPLFRWDVGENVTASEHATYLSQVKMFRAWFNDKVMGDDKTPPSDAIMVLPYGNPGPKYRDLPPPAPTTFEGIEHKFLSPMLQTPQLVVPFAKMPYQSRISGRIEHRPICSSIMGAKGSDLMLIRLVEESFAAASWPTSIETGRYTFTLGDNLRNVASVRAQDDTLGFVKEQRPLYK